MSSFTIMIDTGCDLPQDFIKENALATISIPFQIDGVQQNEPNGPQVTIPEFYGALRNGSVAGTAQINPDAYVQVFTEYAERGESLLTIFLSSGLSPSYHNSVTALDEVKEKYPDCDIHTVDSLNAAPGIGLVTILAIRKRAEGLSAAETAAWLNEKKHSCFSLFTVDDLMFLHRGGRVSKLQAVAGSIIGIKPLLNVAPDGSLKLKDKARGRKAALETLVSQMKRSLKPETVSVDTVLIGHGDCEEDAKILAQMVKSSFAVKELITVMIGPVIGAHSGPGTMALFFVADMARDDYEAKFYGAK